MSIVTGAMDRLRQPEYLGENRCIPCTVVNIVIAAAVSGGLAYVSVVAGPGWGFGAGIGVGSFVLFLALIYLRGYLIPYTPTLTKRYLPDRVLRWFDKHPTDPAVDRPDAEPIDVETTLFSIGAIEECAEMDDWCLDTAFRQAWRDRIRAIRDEDRTVHEQSVARLLDNETDAVTVRQYGEAAIVTVDGRQIGQWESNSAFIADVAADTVLREWSDEWADLHLANRSQLLNSLRMFLERCPSCDGPVTLGQDTVESCCRSFEVVAVSCEGCGARLFEIELTDEMERQLKQH